jgi:hypothetical protein
MVCKEERRRSFASTHARAAIEWTVDWPLEKKGDAFEYGIVLVFLTRANF